MKDIETIKEQAKKGDVQSQVELAHAYLNGESTIKNRALYLKWLEQAGRQGHLESQLELIAFYTQKKNKYSDPVKALFWIREAQKLGTTFTDEQLIEVGEPEICGRLIEKYLFGEGKEHNFEKAKDLILRVKPSQESLLDYAKRYYDIYHDNTKMLSNICYLLKLSFNQNHQKLNEYAVELTKNKAKNNMKIAFSLFSEAYRLGNPYAASSYLYCLLNGKGCRKNIKSGASIYFDCKRKNIDIGRAFVSSARQGIVSKLPNSLTWKMSCFKHKFIGMQEKIGDTSDTILWGISELFCYLWFVIKKIGISSIVFSLLILIGIMKLNFSWCITVRQFIEGLIPITWVGYIILFFIFTAVISVSRFIYKKNRKPVVDEYLRKQWKEYGLILPPFYVISEKQLEQTDGCFGPSTSSKLYTIRFAEEVPNWTFQQTGHWVNPDYSLESYHIRIKQLSEDTAEVTVNWEYVP
jgi:hypothetical protein